MFAKVDASVLSTTSLVQKQIIFFYFQVAQSDSVHFSHCVCFLTGQTTCIFKFDMNVIICLHLFLMLCITLWFFFFFPHFLFAYFMHRVSGTAGSYGILCSQTALLLLTQYCAKTYWSAHRFSCEGAERRSASSQADWVCHQESRDPW